MIFLGEDFKDKQSKYQNEVHHKMHTSPLILYSQNVNHQCAHHCSFLLQPLLIHSITLKGLWAGQWETITVQNQKGDQERKHYFSISLE